MGETKYEARSATDSFTSRAADTVPVRDDILFTISVGRVVQKPAPSAWDAVGDDIMATVFAELRY